MQESSTINGRGGYKCMHMKKENNLFGRVVAIIYKQEMH